MSELKIWMEKPGVQPPELVSLLGIRVRRAWLSPSGTMLLVRLQGNQIILAQPGSEVGGLSAIEIMTGEADPDKDWDAIDRLMVQSPHTRELRYREFTGIDHDVITFGTVGAHIKRTGIQWVRRPN